MRESWLEYYDEPDPERVGQDQAIADMYEHEGAGEELPPMTEPPIIDAKLVAPWMDDLAAAILHEPKVHPFLHMQAVPATFQLEEITDPLVLRTALANAADLLTRISITAYLAGVPEEDSELIYEQIAKYHEHRAKEAIKDQAFDE